MPDNNTDNPVAALSVMNITQDELLHVDESGHVQVEISPLGYEIGSAPRDRVQQIIAQGLWDAFYELARGKSDDWLINIAKLMAENNKCATNRLLELVLMASNPYAKVEIYQLCMSRKWGAKALVYRDQLLDQFNNFSVPVTASSELDLFCDESNGFSQVIDHLQSVVESRGSCD